MTLARLADGRHEHRSSAAVPTAAVPTAAVPTAAVTTAAVVTAVAAMPAGTAVRHLVRRLPEPAAAQATDKNPPGAATALTGLTSDEALPA